MKITLLKNIGAFGVITGFKNLIPDRVAFDIGENGTLFIGAKSYYVDKCAEIAEWEIKPGPNKIMFVADDGATYSCGTINRNGRFMSVANNLDMLVVDLALKYNEQGEKIKLLEDKLSQVQKQYGISII